MNLETAEAFQAEHERAARVDAMEETDDSHYVAYLSLLEALADGESIADILACGECGESEDDSFHGAIPTQTDAGGPGYFAEDFSPEDFHAYAPNNEDAASAVEHYGLESAEDVLDAINESVLAVEVIRRGDLSSSGYIQSIN